MVRRPTNRRLDGSPHPHVRRVLQPVCFLGDIDDYGSGNGKGNGDHCERKEPGNGQLFGCVNASIPEQGEWNNGDCRF